jgi:N-formylglutamate amidohydrolase
MISHFRTVVAVAAILVAGAAVSGQESSKLILIRQGEIPIILSAPHGGNRPIEGVPPRRGEGVKQFVTVRDDQTDQLAEKLAAELAQRLAGKPYLVVARFERKYLDVNRPPQDAYESDKAKPVYDAYHSALDGFCRDVQKKWKQGLFLDIHGQGVFPDALVRGTNNGKTVELLVKRHGPRAIDGPNSLFGVLENGGWEVVPKCFSNDKEDSRFSGGHIVRTYGSSGGHGIDAIQLEFGGRFRSRNELDRSASRVADAIETFCRAYLPQALRNKSPQSK